MTPPQLQRRFVEAGLLPEELPPKSNQRLSDADKQTHPRNFNTLAHAARSLEKNNFSRFELDFAEQAIFAQLDTAKAPNRSKWLKITGGLAAAVVATWTFSIVSTVQETEPWTARGSTHITRAAEGPKIGIYCVKYSDESVAFVGQSESPFGRITCSIQDDIKLAYQNPTPQWRFVHVAAVAPDQTINWYGPTPTMLESLPVKTSTRPEPLGESRKLAINHRPGTYKVIGIFSDRPISFSEFDILVQSTLSGRLPENSNGRHFSYAEFEVTP